MAIHTLQSMLEQIQYEIKNGPEGCENALFVIENNDGVLIPVEIGNGNHSNRYISDLIGTTDVCIFNSK